MPGSIEEYLHWMLQLAAESLLISSSHIDLDKRTPRTGLLRGELRFTDGSKLYFRELTTVGVVVERLMYSYHFQSEDGTLIFRYDDTAHHRELSGFPYHKHAGDEKNVLAAQPPDFQAVLREIERTLELKSGR